MRIYNTLNRRVEEIIPLEANRIRMYSCGPTVYRYIHIGNLRTFTMADWLRRVFEYNGVQIQHIKNITDVGHMRQEMLDRGEDKIISQARKEGKTSAQIAQFYTDAFHADEQALNILPAHVFPRATDHVAEMIEIIAGLLAKGVAYRGGENIYFDIKRFPTYGKLSGNQLENMLDGVREGRNEEKRNPEDFPLWKAAESGREMAWESPWGRGFPGWHIECSAMSMKYLGPQFDVHTGGVDNIFPHHEDEIAQSEGFTGQPYVNYWVHAQHLLADGQKMAKSTGNAYTRADIEARGFDAMALRYFYTTALYRSRLNFTFRALQAAQTSLERLRDRAYALLQASERAAALATDPLPTSAWRTAFLEAVENDLNFPRAMALVWEMLRASELDATNKVRLLLDFDRILGFGLRDYLLSEEPERKLDPRTYLAAVPVEIAAQVETRQALRQQQRFAEADQIRASLATAGYTLRDTRRGSLILPRRLDDEFTVLSSSGDAPNHPGTPDQFEFSINLLAHNSRADLARCLESIRRHANGHALEIVIVDNGSTDETLPYLQALARAGDLIGENGESISLQVLFADHNMGFAAGRNATMRASRGRFVVLLDTSIELNGDIWQPLAELLADPLSGVAGPYGLVTDDLREFREAAGPDVDAIEGYLMAFRRALLPEVGWIDERFRFYRLMDIYFSFFFKTAGYRALTVPVVEQRLIKHPHREWFSLTEEEQATKSKKNYDIFRARWHHGESLLAANFRTENRWPGHDQPRHVQGDHAHAPGELPPPGAAHTHTHQHWPDHSHEHAHYHSLPAAPN
ncbi:MAG TPA: cysteine--tRNA ligase [Ktedonobacteraceae bacterium]|nr:cysteine--tRNA ligase [Ktedonobacteraceae bacterium]